MNRERAKELLPIIQAFAEGKGIECREYEGDKWRGDSSMVPDFAFHDHLQYRIKPEPREFWTVIFNDGEGMSSGHPTKEEAEKHIRLVRSDSPNWCPEAYVARVMEVLDD